MLTTFIDGANSKKTTLTTTFTTLVSAVITTVNGKQSLFTTAGSTLMIRFIAGVKSQDTNSRTAFTNIISGCLTAIKNKYSEFESAGKECMIRFIAGVKSQEANIKQPFISSLSQVVNEIRNHYDQFYSAGSYLVDGFAAGISANAFKAAAQARAMALAAARAAEQALNVNSPSKVFYRIGDYAGQGFVNALNDYESKSYDAGSGMAESAKNGLSDAVSKIIDVINGDIDTRPTIRPVLDLSNVEAGTSRLNVLFSRTRALSISAGMGRRNDTEIQNEENSANNGGIFTFTQNNYSPKALSRVEIYRHTKNQFSAMERMVQA
jgi:hypothetical protein